MALTRELGLPGAVALGMGSIVGTGVFVSLGIAAGITGPSVVAAITIAAAVAACNGLSSAQLAAAFPVSGGTYEYAHRTVGRPLGVVAGWTFLGAKSASAATAALGTAGYLLHGAGGRPAAIGLAVALVAAITVVCAGGLRRSNRVNAAIVSVTLVALVAFIASGLASADRAHFTPFATGGARGLLEASALVFVAFTGYGRIATLGEEVRDPARTIPRAIVVTLILTAVLYVAVAFTAVGAIGADALATDAPLERAAAAGAVPAVRWLVAAGAVTAMLGVLLNLVLGLSRVALAMARRRDLPGALAAEHAGTPRAAVIAVGVVIAALCAIGSVRTTWSVSAVTVLLYYAITNLAALRLPPEHRRYPRVLAVIGLIACLGLAIWVVA